MFAVFIIAYLHFCLLISKASEDNLSFALQIFSFGNVTKPHAFACGSVSVLIANRSMPSSKTSKGHSLNVHVFNFISLFLSFLAIFITLLRLVLYNGICLQQKAQAQHARSTSQDD